MDSEDAKNIAETIALICAAVFFGYKAIVGYFYVDLCLGISSQRHPFSDAEDIVVVTAKLKKGSRGSVRIHDMQAKLTFDGHMQFLPFIGFHRISYVTEPIGSSERQVANWAVASRSAPFLRLPPDEETEFSCYARVPKKAVGVVEVAVLGRERSWLGVGQWKASHVTVPRA